MLMKQNIELTPREIPMVTATMVGNVDLLETNKPRQDRPIQGSAIHGDAQSPSVMKPLKNADSSEYASSGYDRSRLGWATDVPLIADTNGSSEITSRGGPEPRL